MSFSGRVFNDPSELTGTYTVETTDYIYYVSLSGTNYYLLLYYVLSTGEYKLSLVSQLGSPYNPPYPNPGLLSDINDDILTFNPSPSESTVTFSSNIVFMGQTLILLNPSNDYIICYNEGTTVLTKINNEKLDYIPIENLKPGMLIETYKHGVLPIKFIGKRIINNGHTELTSMFKIPKSGNMNNDLIVSGSHNILLNEIPSNLKKKYKFYNKKRTIDKKYRILACHLPNSEQILEKSKFTLYHFVIDGRNLRYGIYVNGGLLSESTTEKDFKNFGFTPLS